MQWRANWLKNIFLLGAFAFLLYNSGVEFHNIAAGTGNWYQDFSQKWYFAYWSFILLSLALLVCLAFELWFPEKTSQKLQFFIKLRERSNVLRRAAGLLIVILPLFLMEFTAVGLVLRGIYLRLLIVTLSVLALAFILNRSNTDLVNWRSILTSAFIFSAMIIIPAQFTDVVDYPFSLGWSEGNRLWDFSTLFGRNRYIYPANLPLVPYLDFGRQLIGGLAFLWPGLGIAGARFWVDFTDVFPYFLLGLAIFRPVDKKDKWLWLAMSVWTVLFLRQVSIHPPLVVSAILLAFVWRKSLWVSVPVIIIAAYFAAISRFTWTFAVGIWAVMLEFTINQKIDRQVWIRSIIVGLAGIFGGFLLPKLIGSIQGQYDAGVSTAQIEAHLKIQPLLWYRLLPNATYSDGVLFGMLKVAIPLIIVLAYLVVSGRWKLTFLHKLALVLPLLAFMVVGLIVSTKAGGGGDLHNLDMFFIGLLFTTVIAWFNGGRQWIRDYEAHPFFIRLMMLTILLIPILYFIGWLRPAGYSGNIASLLILTDTKNAGALGILPAREKVDEALDVVRAEVAESKKQGEVLFMDQRQLLTFGYITDVPLVADYEKKMVMDHAMSRKADYFAQFYRDLASHRFSLIVSEPLRVPVKTSEFEFGEENNSWVDWVSKPVLCYYEPVETFTEFRLQLLKPRLEPVDCSSVIPPEALP